VRRLETMHTQLIGATRPWSYTEQGERDYRGDLRQELHPDGATAQLVEYLRAHAGRPILLADAMHAIGRSHHSGQLLLETAQHNMPEYIIYELDEDDKSAMDVNLKKSYIVVVHKDNWGEAV
jgi:hypothetical protein